MKQNLYDGKIFFNRYTEYRKNNNSFNRLIEEPQLKKLLPDLSGKRVLDIGSGFGFFCEYAEKNGAQEVHGIDISNNMVSFAQRKNNCKNVKFEQVAIEDFEGKESHYDIIISSLALHYVLDKKNTFKKIYSLLKQGGHFIFSVNHPLYLSNIHIDNKSADEEYFKEGKREHHWLIDGVIKYHSTFSSYISFLLDTGFCIESIVEPNYDPDISPKELKLKAPLFIFFASYK